MNMKKFLYLLFAMFITVGLNACSPDDDPENEPPTEIPENPDDPDQPDNPDPIPTLTLARTRIRQQERRSSSITVSRTTCIPSWVICARRSKPM